MNTRMNWCPPCKSYHVTPRTKEGHAALQCRAPWKGDKITTTETSAPKLEAGLPQLPIMDEEDARADLKNQCAELKARNAALEAALRNCLIPLQDAQNQLHHTRAAAAYLDAKLLLRES